MDGESRQTMASHLHFRFTLMTLFVIVAVASGLSWFMSQLEQSRELAYLAQCKGQLSQLALSLQTYQEWYGTFPPPFIADEDGAPMHSWRVLLLAAMNDETRHIFDQYDFDEPWNGPNNAKLASRMPHIYQCPNHSTDDDCVTNYVAIIPADLPEGSVLSPNRVLVAEVSEICGREVHWMEPIDLRVDEMSFAIGDRNQPSLSSNDLYGPGVIFANGDVERLSRDMTQEQVRAIVVGEQPASNDGSSTVVPAQP